MLQDIPSCVDDNMQCSINPIKFVIIHTIKIYTYTTVDYEILS